MKNEKREKNVALIERCAVERTEQRAQSQTCLSYAESRRTKNVVQRTEHATREHGAQRPRARSRQRTRTERDGDEETDDDDDNR